VTLTSEQIEAMAAGPEMDGLVAELVMRLEHGADGTYCAEANSTFTTCPRCAPGRYSRDIAAAWVVVEAVRERADPDGFNRWYFDLFDEALPDAPWVALFYHRPHRGKVSSFEARGDVASVAICRAALLSTVPA
jgi:hypothetical protein